MSRSFSFTYLSTNVSLAEISTSTSKAFQFVERVITSGFSGKELSSLIKVAEHSFRAVSSVV